MSKPYSNAGPYVAQLKGIEGQINQNQLSEAAAALNLLAKDHSHDPRLFLLGSRLAEAARNPDGVLLAARKAHALAPGWPVATIHLASVLGARNEAEEAMALARQAIQQASDPLTQATIDTELLTKAAAVADRLKHHAQAVKWLRQAEKISPDDLNLRYKIGLVLTHGDDPASAVDIFTEMLLQQPDNPALLSARMHACMMAQQMAQAIGDGETLLAMDPANEEHQFYLDFARGLNPVTQPASVITRLFDGQTRFDQLVAGELHDKLPRDVAQRIRLWYPDLQCDVLDLGCGTGSLGVGLGRMPGVLVGVDLSGAMLDEAARHGVYDSFHQVNLLDALSATPGDHYHLVVALDVLTYVGSLDTVIPNAYRILLPGGRFVFSCETGVTGEGDYTLQSSYRYTYQLSYVRRLLQLAGFIIVEVEDRVLRHDPAQPVDGFLVTASKPPSVVAKSGSRPKKSGKALP